MPRLPFGDGGCRSSCYIPLLCGRHVRSLRVSSGFGGTIKGGGMLLYAFICFALLCVPNAASTGFWYVNPAFSSLNVAFLAINVTFNGRVLPVSAASFAMLFCRVSFGCRRNEDSSGMPLSGEGVPGTGACRAGGLCLAPQTQAFDTSDTSLCRAERLCLSRQSPAARERGGGRGGTMVEHFSLFRLETSRISSYFVHR